MSNNYTIISIEGNIGSGKSTLLANLREHFKDNVNIVFLKEPVNGMEKCPKGILTNIARYTPYEDLEKMIAKENGVPVFEAFQFDSFCV